ncbi:MAG: helix-turn-helix domain-containing protein [Lachnospiraceae bacterium]|nr:helix-turn-helix transcriptional regulator [Lachnospiraceae bacterium]
MTVNEVICCNIAELRKKRGLSQEELACMLDITFQAVSKWENQLSCPDIALIPKIAEIFQVSIDFLFGQEEKKTMEKHSTEWPNDNNLYAVIFQGHQILKKEEITDDLSQIELKYDGNMQGITIKSYFSVTVTENITDSTIQSGTHITCADITDSKIESGTHITCADIYDCDSICSGAHITCADIYNCDNICSGAHINAADITCNSINAKTCINASNISQNKE